MSDLQLLFAGWIADGAYTLKLDFLNSTVEIPIVVEAGVVTAAVVALNENYSYTGKVVNPEGETVPITSEEQQFDCFQFNTF